jgi:hypothetical protein
MAAVGNAAQGDKGPGLVTQQIEQQALSDGEIRGKKYEHAEKEKRQAPGKKDDPSPDRSNHPAPPERLCSWHLARSAASVRSGWRQ